MTGKHLLFFVLFCLYGGYASGQATFNLVADLNPGADGSGVNKSGAVLGGKFFFPATTPDTGEELFVSDGTAAGTQLLVDLVPGAEGSAPDDLTVVGDQLFFSATTPAVGRELFVTDGTTAGTRLVKDIFPGTQASIDDGFFHDAIAYRGALYFNAHDQSDNFEVWKSDGTEAGTFQLKNISEANFFGENSAFPDQFTIAGPYLYFAARNNFNDTEVWRTDGTEAGTIRVAQEGMDNFDDNPFALTAFRDSLYFGAESSFGRADLFRSGGQENDAVRVLDLPNRGLSGSTNDGGPFFATLDDQLFFAADTGRGPDLWVTDGSVAGTSVLIDGEEAGFGGYVPQSLIRVGDYVYFKDELPETGIELWRTDGTPEGTILIEELASGRNSSLFLPPAFHAFQDRLFFAARGPVEDGFGTNGIELYVTEGTPEGIELAADVNPGGDDSDPNYFTTKGDSLFFFATTEDAGRELFVLTFTPVVPPLAVNDLVVTEPGCRGDSTGTVSFTISGGVPPYNLTEDTIRRTGLPAGEFSLLITDSRDSSLLFDTLLSEPARLRIVLTALEGQRADEGGSIAVIPQGGTPRYTFTWADTSLMSSLRDDLVAGTYFLTLTDANGCVARDSIVIDDLTSLRPLVLNRDFKVYPTVVHQELTLETAAGSSIKEIYVYTATGALVRRIPVFGSAVRVPRADLGSGRGLHFLRLVGNDRREALTSIILSNL